MPKVALKYLHTHTHKHTLSLRVFSFFQALWEGPGSPMSPGPGCITVATYDLPVTKEEMRLVGLQNGGHFISTTAMIN